MNKYCITIDSAGAKVLVTSTDSNIIKKLEQSEFLQRYVPNCKILHDSVSAVANIILKTGKPDFFLKYPKAKYTNIFYEDKDIVSLIEFLLEGVRQEAGIYCLHSSSAVINGRNIIFWGNASGMGKTRLALTLSEKFGAQMYSDEKTLLNLQENVTVGGIASIYLSKPYLQDKFGNADFYDFIQPGKSFPVGFFVYPHIDEDSKSIHIERWGANKFSWHLYEELSRKIRGTSRRIFNNTLPVSSIDSISIATQRSLAVEDYAKSTPCYYMRGSEALICENIVKLCDK
ncbi:MAG: hypothetical protein AAB824_01790 [Patescibacteria group bacterium]